MSYETLFFDRCRYMTYYGTDLELYTYEVADGRIAEEIFKRKFHPYNKSGELYDIKYRIDYQCFCEELSSMKIDLLTETLNKIEKVKKKICRNFKNSSIYNIVIGNISQEDRTIFEDFYKKNNRLFTNMATAIQKQRFV